VNAHGTSTSVNDAVETKAIRLAFGQHADSLMVSSTKSMIGHTLGAAGAIEAIVTVLSLRDGIVPPTINLENPDPACDLDYVPGTARQAKLDYAVSNSFGFGGQNISVLFGKA
jgi:3-oxoacyl-[acyl-carrier-protein] synthase II